MPVGMGRGKGQPIFVFRFAVARVVFRLTLHVVSVVL